MKIRLLRHSTFLLSYSGKKIMVDPMFMSSGMMKPIPTRNEGRGRRNPLVVLPVDENELNDIISNLDAVLITHMHFDHFFETENVKFSRNITVLCQPDDVQKLKALGFKKIQLIDNDCVWKDIKINRIECQHGGIVISKFMGKGSGYILSSSHEETIYVSGDTIWNSNVKNALLKYTPKVTILYAGAAQLPIGRSITMNKSDIAKVCMCAPNTEVVAIHMETINHCLLTRKELRSYLEEKQLMERVKILEDGEEAAF